MDILLDSFNQGEPGANKAHNPASSTFPGTIPSTLLPPIDPDTSKNHLQVSTEMEPSSFHPKFSPHWDIATTTTTFSSSSSTTTPLSPRMPVMVKILSKLSPNVSLRRRAEEADPAITKSNPPLLSHHRHSRTISAPSFSNRTQDPMYPPFQESFAFPSRGLDPPYTTTQEPTHVTPTSTLSFTGRGHKRALSTISQPMDASPHPAYTVTPKHLYAPAPLFSNAGDSQRIATVSAPLLRFKLQDMSSVLERLINDHKAAATGAVAWTSASVTSQSQLESATWGLEERISKFMPPINRASIQIYYLRSQVEVSVRVTDRSLGKKLQIEFDKLEKKANEVKVVRLDCKVKLEVLINKVKLLRRKIDREKRMVEMEAARERGGAAAKEAEDATKESAEAVEVVGALAAEMRISSD